jgi:predicted helicase
MATSALHELLESIRSSSTSERDKGDKFERLMRAYFRTEPAYRRQFENVWLWSDWPGNKGKPDTGIDLVAKNSDGSGYTAIQCKNYAPTTMLDKKDIDSFFTESGKSPFSYRIIVATTNNWTKHAEESLTNQDKPVRRIGIDALESSTIDWGRLDFRNLSNLHSKPSKQRRPHQLEAVKAVTDGFKLGSRGKLIMACGTGKTYTAQCIAEDLVGVGGTVLVLVPSISLLSQTLKEWTSDAQIPISVFAVCSDEKAGKKRDVEDISPYDLILPATTNTEVLVKQFKKNYSKKVMTIVFSTYQSITVISEAQKAGIPEFDLIIADEAHRTTGVTLSGNEDSNFTKVHNDKVVGSKRRLYMTATPRVFSDGAKAKANSADAILASMDDESIFGPEFFRLGFHESVTRGLLTDYKVLVLVVNEEAIAAAFQQQLSDENHELNLDDATRIVGCLNALSKHDPTNRTFVGDSAPMKRVVAFSNTIANSKKFKNLFTEVADRFVGISSDTTKVKVEVDHVDGTFNSLKREELIGWLKNDPGENHCNILSNARCLTEGVDIPALDAIIFLEPRNSMVDVIQAVGRVMRKLEGKQFGYVILPIGIPANETPEQALNDNKRFAAVWQVLNALRSHDERMNAVINKLELNELPPDMIDVIPVGFDDDSDPEDDDKSAEPTQLTINFPLDAIKDALFAKMVERVGTRHYWESWAADIAQIASKHHTRISALLQDKKLLPIRKEFDQFLSGLRTSINDGISEDDAIAMLSQHLITKPIFDALFENYDLSKNNDVARVMQKMIDTLDAHALDKETEKLEGFYANVRLRVEGIDNAAGRQRVITELYEHFFSKAFPKESESLGIVYTPIDVVDFIIAAADNALRKHFGGLRITDKGVNVLDPFLGTGTFLVRLLQNGTIQESDMKRKFTSELHGNEILLLAYYIAAVNIESTYFDALKTGTNYEGFNGIVLTDTFQMSEKEPDANFYFSLTNDERVKKQKVLQIKAIIGNPPYSLRQESENDQNQNQKYPSLDKSIESTYAKLSSARNMAPLYDSYSRAFRWATNRLYESKDGGVISFVTNGGFLESKSFDGFRKSLQSEFHHIYIFNLRGNARTSGEQRRAEGGNVFDSGSRATVVITVLVKLPEDAPSRGAEIHYFDIGDYLTREQKLSKIAGLVGVNILDNIEWKNIEPNASADWINQRIESFAKLEPLTNSDGASEYALFENRYLGLVSNRDAWNYNSSQIIVVANTKHMVNFFNSEVTRIHKPLAGKKPTLTEVKEKINFSDKDFSWSRSDFARLQSAKKYDVESSIYLESMYRPYFKQYLNASRQLNENPGKLADIFAEYIPNQMAICVSGGSPFGSLMVNVSPDRNMLSGGCFAFLRYLPDNFRSKKIQSLFDAPSELGAFYDNLSDETLVRYQKKLGHSITKDDIFFYIYGILHSTEYLNTYSSNLSKELPRIPFPTSEKDFHQFSKAGKLLADLHTNYESLEPFNELQISGGAKTNAAFKVNKMRFNKNGKADDRTKIIYNSGLAIENIPEEAYRYTVGTKSAIEWVMDRYQVTEDKKTGIRNDVNDWSTEHNDDKYIFLLLQRIVTCSMKTNEIVARLPRLSF